MSSPKKQTLLTPILRWFLFTMVLANIAGSMGQMLMPLYLTELGASITDVGIVFTLNSVAILVMQVFGGWVSDSIGRLKAIAIGSVGGIFGFFMIVWAPTWQWLIVAMVVSSFPRALIGPSFSAFIADNSAEEKRGQVYGIVDTIYQITGIVGPPLGGFLAYRFGYPLMFLTAAILYTAAAGLRIWMATTMKSEGESEPEELTFGSLKTSLKTVFGMILSGGVITWIFLTDGVRDIAFRLSGEIEPLYLEQIIGLNAEQIGLLGSFASIAMMLPPILSGKMSDKYGERVPLALGFMGFFVAYMVFLNVNTFVMFGVVWAIFGFSVGILSPAYNSLISKVVPKNMLATFNGFFYSGIGLISLPAPYIGTVLWEKVSPRFPFMITAGVVLLTVIPIWYKFRVPEDSENDGVKSELVEVTG